MQMDEAYNCTGLAIQLLILQLEKCLHAKGPDAAARPCGCTRPFVVVIDLDHRDHKVAKKQQSSSIDLLWGPDF